MTFALQDISKRVGLGRLAYRLWYRPRQWCDWGRAYGWRLTWRAARGDRPMAAAARLLPAQSAAQYRLEIPVYFLTGRHFWHQTAFCVHSLQHFTDTALPLYFASDGTLDATIGGRLTTLFPGARILDHHELDERTAAALPPARYPTLHTHRRCFVLLRKLTDTLTDGRGYRLFLDSDMLFWRRPDELLRRARRSEPLYLADLGDDGYALPRAVLKQRLGVEPASGVNSGLVGAYAERVDWDLIERACKLLVAEGRDQRLLEQTLWAVVLATQEAKPLDAREYRVVINPPGLRAALAAGRPALLHYAWHARLPYVADEWRRYIETLMPNPGVSVTGAPKPAEPPQEGP
ncbi:MAG: hypothetical protein PHE83_15810 [Opitutaceae bacterium]|nr:hypothetical protein [Opitutaceae bacterium]